MNIVRHFSGSYAESRNKFLGAATWCDASVETFVLLNYRGALGEELAIDVAYLGGADVQRLLILSSGTHGPEGFCGAGCQIAALHDTDIRARFAQSGIGVLMIHAINPYGFSYLQRTNQDNVDLNRNHIDFQAPLPANARYASVESLALPATWPPSPENELTIAVYNEQYGASSFFAALSTGQYDAPTGMFYGGKMSTWNNGVLRAILRRYAASAAHIGWIDIHTGLGPYGHGEKIHAGRNAVADTLLGRSWWGSDVFAPYEGRSVSPGVSGPVVSIVYDECPREVAALLGLEFGTFPLQEMIYRLRASHWLLNHPEAPVKQQQKIRRQLRDAFYCDNDDWKAMAWGQTRVVMLQALLGLNNR